MSRTVDDFRFQMKNSYLMMPAKISLFAKIAWLLSFAHNRGCLRAVAFSVRPIQRESIVRPMVLYASSLLSKDGGEKDDYLPRSFSNSTVVAGPNGAEDVTKRNSTGTPRSYSNSSVLSAGFSSNGAKLSSPPPYDASATLGVDPNQITFQPVSKDEKEAFSSCQSPFVTMFRGSAKYIANHRNTLAVYHIPGGLLDMPDPNVFRDLMHDIAITWLLGMKIVLVVGCRHQIEKRLGEVNRDQGLRVTNKETLKIVKEEAGSVRFEVERQLARCLRGQGMGAFGGGVASGGYYDGNVVSGNFYSSQPYGIRDGLDFE